MPKKKTDTITKIAESIIKIRDMYGQNQYRLEFAEKGSVHKIFFALVKVNLNKSQFVRIETLSDSKVFAEICLGHRGLMLVKPKERKKMRTLSWDDWKQKEELIKEDLHFYYKDYDVEEDTDCFLAAADIVKGIIVAYDYRPDKPVEITIKDRELLVANSFFNNIFFVLRTHAKELFLSLARLFK